MEPCTEEHLLEPLGQEWLENIFLLNNITPSAFLKDVKTVLTSAHPKRRTLFLEGASNTGKTLLQELLLSGQGSVGYAELTGKERFELMPIIDADFAVISEFRATIRNVDKAKRLFGGEKMPVELKNRGTVIVSKKPVIVTAQSGWSGWLGQTDLLAIQNRIHYYKFTRALPECSVILCQCYWKDLEQKWIHIT